MNIAADHRWIRPLLLLSILTTASMTALADSAAVREINDLHYTEGAPDADPRHRLNLVVPEGAEDAPLLMWIPGGAWAVGERKREMPIARAFARNGIAVAVVDHRMSPGAWIDERYPETGATHPDHIQDTSRAFAWLEQNAAQYGIDPDRLFVGGFSAGAHLSALMAMDPQWLEAAGTSRERIRAAIPVGGAYDMNHYYEVIVEAFEQPRADQHVLGVFGSVEALTEASPDHYLDSAKIPMLVLSEGDTYGYTALFEERVEAAGKDDLIEFRHYREESHRSLFEKLGQEGAGFPPFDAIVDYIQSRGE
jgi:acetyl esterase/lipase